MKTATRKPKNQIPTKWLTLIRSIPGYDPTTQCGKARFDPSRAEHAIKIIETVIRHCEGDGVAGTPFLLERWERAIVANLFGWVLEDAKGRTVRRYRECLLYVPRKNGKTAFAAALVLVLLFFDGEPGAQVYSAAADREQATLIFRHAKGMISQSPGLTQRCKVYESHKSVQLLSDQSAVYRALSAEAYTKHGLNCHAAIIDELHAQPNRELVDVLTSSMGARSQPLTIYTTTADYVRESVCNEKYDYACRVRDNSTNRAIGVDDSRFLPVIYEADRDDDWTDKAVWRKANPNLGVTISLDFLEAECKKARDIPAYENTFRRLYLNQRTEQDRRAISMEQWSRCGRGADPVEWRARMLQELSGRQCFAGLDLGATNDLTAFVLLFAGDTKPWAILPWFWATSDAVERRRRRQVPYDVWIRQGFMSETPGNVTDYDTVRTDVGDLASMFGIRDLAIDRLFQGAQLATQLQGDGFNVVAFGQGFMSMAYPTKRLLELISAGDIDHGNNPVLAWMAGSASTETDAAGNLKFSKAKSTEKIDGLIALTMALGRAETSTSDNTGGMEFWS